MEYDDEEIDKEIAEKEMGILSYLNDIDENIVDKVFTVDLSNNIIEIGKSYNDKRI